MIRRGKLLRVVFGAGRFPGGAFATVIWRPWLTRARVRSKRTVPSASASKRTGPAGPASPSGKVTPSSNRHLVGHRPIRGFRPQSPSAIHSLRVGHPRSLLRLSRGGRQATKNRYIHRSHSVILPETRTSGCVPTRGAQSKRQPHKAPAADGLARECPRRGCRARPLPLLASASAELWRGASARWSTRT